ncbi:MAG: ATP-binding protein [Candidatus Deferrimicrobiaceae bacterium]
MTNPFPFLSTGFLPIQNIKATLAKREDSEHEQAIIRLVIVVLLAIYISLSVGQNRRIDPDEIATVAIAVFCLLFSASVFTHIVLRPVASPLRRVIGIVHDNGMAAYMMYALGEYCAPFYIILLWVTFGNGFRYGRKYLFASAFLGSAFFSLVITTTEYWKSHPTLGFGLLLGLIVLPAYVSSLLKKLTDAISRAEEANSAKNQFLANMSHEMRTPLGGILGMVDLLRGTPLTTEQQDFANTIHASSKTLLFLIEDVLDISKIEAGKISVEKVDFDLHSLLKNTMGMVAQQAREKGLGISTQIPSRIPFQLRGDPLLIRQVLLNLLSNAVKFTEAGEVCLRVDQIRETATTVSLRIEVSDTGIGIPPEAQARIFERFTQADASITRRYGGTGLGTTIAKQLVELMGGEIGLQSEPGTGATFWFTLNLGKQVSQATGIGALSGSRILVISSDGNSSYIIKNHLASWGVDAVIVDKAAHAFSPLISAANDGVPFQVAIIVGKDLDMDPCELGRALKSVRIIHNVQLILVSKEENEPDLSDIMKYGFSAAIGASLDKPLLFNAVHFVRPVDGDAESVPSLADRYRQKKEEEQRGLRVLVAEDNLTNQKVIAKILERAGHRPHLVENGEQALDAMEKEKFDLVLLDLHMPVMGGLETAKIARFTQHGPSSQPPLVALTADATQESRKACEEAGFDAYLTKPVEVKKLIELIDSLITAGREGHAATATAQAHPAGNGASEEGRGGPVIDPATVNELAALGEKEDFLEKLIQIFLETGEQNIENIEKAMLARNYSRVSELAHGLKGSAGQIGASTLMELCNRISHTQPVALMNEGNETVKVLRNEFGRVRAALQEHVQEAGAKGASYGKGGRREGNSGKTLPHTFRNR